MPRFSPDGTRVAFEANRDGNSEIYAMNADGTGVDRLTNHPEIDFRPRFSPDGSRILWETKRDGNVELYDQQTREWTAIPPIGTPYKGVEWGRGLFDLADSLRLGTPQRVTGTQALHVLEICLGILSAAETGHPVAISSTFDPPPPLD